VSNIKRQLTSSMFEILLNEKSIVIIFVEVNFSNNMISSMTNSLNWACHINSALSMLVLETILLGNSSQSYIGLVGENNDI
jgi:hypothetical protein